jgi:protein TonB
MFATSWRTGHAESEAAKKAIDSFRLLPVVAAQDKPPLSSASNTTEPDSQQAYRVSGDIKPPRVISRNEPNYPQQARKGQAAGPIVIWMIVDSDGGTRDIHVHHGISPELDHAAVEAVEKWRFEPATTEGKPVSVRIAIQFDFQP